MTQGASKPSPATRRRNGTDQPASNGRTARGVKAGRREQDLAGERDKRHPRHEQNEQVQHGDRDEQDSRREQGLTGERDERGPRDGQSERWQHDKRDEQDSPHEGNGQPGSVQRTVGTEPGRYQLGQATDWPFALTPTLDMTKMFTTMFTTMFELGGAMVKLQQQTFASMIGATNTYDTNTYDTNSGDTNSDHRGHHDAVSASRTSSAEPDQIEHDRR